MACVKAKKQSLVVFNVDRPTCMCLLNSVIGLG